jgi:hypothetical protein
MIPKNLLRATGGALYIRIRCAPLLGEHRASELGVRPFTKKEHGGRMGEQNNQSAILDLTSWQ